MIMDDFTRQIRSRFIELFKAAPLIVTAPGRINLIGEHTDYNDGFVMPAAIDKGVAFAIAPSPDDQCLIFSQQYEELFPVNLLTPRPVDEPRWANYLLGVLHQFVQRGLPVRPFCCLFGGDIPAGAGLSSSAALECGFAFALNELFQLQVPRQELVRIGQWAEHNFVGVKCGIMDQFASMMGKEGHAILLDCKSLEYKYAPLVLGDHTILLCNSGVKHALVNSEYNLRRSACEEGVALLQRHYPQVTSLRDVSAPMLEAHRGDLPEKVYQRCHYVVREIPRVVEASGDLERGDLMAFGRKMFETHAGLSRQYEVSCPELDFLVERARNCGDIPGARMMGGGFGGCTINLIRKAGLDDFVAETRTAYEERFSLPLETYPVNVGDGTRLVTPF